MKDKIIKIIKNNLLQECVLVFDFNDKFMDLGIDSLTCISMVVELEDEFGISIFDEDYEDLTINQFIDMVIAKVEE